MNKISEGDKRNYDNIIKILAEKFDEKYLSQMYFNKLQARKQLKDENFITFSEEIERLTNLAYLDSSEKERDRVACFSFINGIHDQKIDFALRSERFETLRKAVARATELQSITHVLNMNRQFSNSFNYRFPNNNYNPSSNSDKQNKPSNHASNIQCFKCQQFGHYANKCTDMSFVKCFSQ